MSHGWIIAACRTPIGKLLGGLSAIPAPTLASLAIREALIRGKVAPDEVDEVILGQVLQAGVGQAPARQATLLANIPPRVGALTINKVCGSGLKAVMLADQAIRAGDCRIVVAGGMENMSQSPHLLPWGRRGIKFGNGEVVDSMLHDGLWCATENVAMGSLAEATASECKISREAQDQFSLASHRKAAHAQTSRLFAKEIVPVVTARGETVDRDEGPRGDASLEGLQKLRPAFCSASAVLATITAGNASQISDGAAAVVVVDAITAERIPSPVRARIVASATSGLAPRDIFLAPAKAIEAALEKAQLTIEQIDLFEINEAFAAQVLACQRPLGVPDEKLNVHGGAIALGHPIGASGARTLVTLLHALAERNLSRGLVSLCLGGGNAVAMIVERQ